MLWLAFKLAFLLTLVAAMPIAIIRAQPYTVAPVEVFLAGSDDCAAPCFLGVQPGQTGLRDALDILERHPWVAQVQANGTTETGVFPFYSVMWSGQQPDWIDGETNGRLFVTFDRRNTIGELAVPLRPGLMTAGDLYLLIGWPPEFFITSRELRGRCCELDTHHLYIARSLTFETSNLCPVTPLNFLRSDVEYVKFSAIWSDRPRSPRDTWFNVLDYPYCS